MGESAETEFARYLDNHGTAVNPLEFFKSHKSSFPKMFKMIPQIICAPGSTPGDPQKRRRCKVEINTRLYGSK